jgi:5,5'-dehydrodivanillate O-demethylase oxygenase subunit
MDKAENELLTRVGPGTRMGALLRRYWWPVWFTEQVTDKPVPVRLLGEDLVLFREPSGKLGLIERYCAHRRVSLEFGRVEEGGIRCCYHGWKYGADGSCVDLPLEPEGSGLKRDVKLSGYAVFEAGGLIFAYLGPKPVPAFPRWDLLFREAGLTKVGADEEHCNWLQRAENTVDQHHLCSLHASVYPQLAFKRSEVDWEPAWFGLNITMRVPGLTKPKLDQFIFPSSNRFTQARIGVPPSHNLRIRVPTDDTKTTTFWVKIYPSITDQGRLKTEGLKPRQRGVYDRAPKMAGGTSLRMSRTASRRKARASSPTARSRRWAGPIAASSFSARCCMTGSTPSPKVAIRPACCAKNATSSIFPRAWTSSLL